MQAIVTALDDSWRERIEEIWSELNAVFRLRAIAGTTEPHFTYHAAEHYDPGLIEAAASGIAESTAKFEIETHGLGVFRGNETVLFLHVTPSPMLRGLHAKVWRAVEDIASDTKGVYAAETWVPHITLAIGDLREEQLPDILALLGRRDYRWHVPVTNLCVIPDVTSKANGVGALGVSSVGIRGAVTGVNKQEWKEARLKTRLLLSQFK